MAAAALIFMTSAIMLQSVSGAPLISKNDTNDTNLIMDEGVEKNATQKSSLLEDGLFEGDIVITEDLIRQHYNFSSIPGGEKYMTHEDKNNVTTEGGEAISKRAAVRSNLRLWTDGVVPYQFSSSIGTNFRHLIRDAMDHWEDRTCLRFTVRNGENDYVEYNNKKRECSSHIGRVVGNQTINIYSENGCPFGTIVHEIGHAAGFWHEQSRPDRNYYVQINLNNVETDKQHNFMKRTNGEVDSRGSEYDYGSVMHYRTTAFVRSNCRGCQSIQVNNTTAYRAQGSPTLGQRTGLSVRDVQQANNLYSCPKRGVTGLLEVYKMDDLYQTLIQYGMLQIPMSKSQQ